MQTLETRNLLSAAATTPGITGFLSADSATFEVGVAQRTVIKSGESLIGTLQESGALPSGLVWTAKPNGNAVISGQPTAGTAGVYVLSVVAKSGNKPYKRQPFTLTVDQSPAIKSADSTVFAVGEAGAFTIRAKGFPIAQIGEAGSLPAGLTFVDNGNGTATISGVPAAAATGSYVLEVTANNGIAASALQTLTLSVDQAPAITSNAAATFPPGGAELFAVTTTGFPSSAITEKGALPPGISFRDNGNGTATISGTPAENVFGTYILNLTAKNPAKPNARQAFKLTIGDAPSIDSAPGAGFTTGVAGSFTVTTGGSLPLNPRLTETGILPAGFRFQDNGNGTATIYGNAPASDGGIYILNLTASNGVAPDASQAFTLSVGHSPVITSSAATTFTAGNAGSFTITTTGFPYSVITENGALPSGLAFQDNGNGTATISGTVPLTAVGGSFPLSLTVSNNVKPDVSQAFTLTVDQALNISDSNGTTFTSGVAGSFTFTTTSSIPITPALTEIGTLPAGVSFVDNGDGTATLSGVPASLTGGVYGVTVTASNGVTPDASQTFLLTVDQPAAFVSSAATTFTVGAAGSFTIVSTTDGFPQTSFGPDGSFTILTPGGFPDNPASFTALGALPAGVGFGDNGNGTATLGGTPAAGTDGTYVIQITADDGIAPNGVQAFTLTVDGAPSITSAATTTFAAGEAASFTVRTSALPVGAITETGSLPAGLAFHDNGNGTATLLGTPDFSAIGTYTLNFTVNNGVAPNATQIFTLVVGDPPVITSGASAAFTAGSPATFTITTAGMPIAAITETGELPAGISFQDNGNGTATLSGTPAISAGGQYLLNIEVNNGIAPDATENFHLNVNAGPNITSAGETFTTGQAGSFIITTNSSTGNIPTLSEMGELPAGISFVDNGNGTATLSGTPAPSTGGVYGLYIDADYGGAASATEVFMLTVDQPPSIFSAAGATFSVGTPGSFSVDTNGPVPTPIFGPDGAFALTTSGGIPTTDVLTEVGALPAGVSFLDNGNGTATISGTPGLSSAGTYILLLTADNGVGPNATQTFTLTVV
jgi:hypothetical protein